MRRAISFSLLILCPAVSLTVLSIAAGGLEAKKLAEYAEADERATGRRLNRAHSGEEAAVSASVSSRVHFENGSSARGVPFRLVGKHIVLPVVVNDSLEIDMILDTGLGFLNGALLLDPGLGRSLGLEYNGQVPLFPHSDKRVAPPQTVVEGREGLLSEGIVGDILAVTGRIPQLRLGSFLLEEVITCFPDGASWGPAVLLGQNGMIGNDVLRRFNVVFDYPGERIFLEPAEKYAEAFEMNMAGLLYVTRPDRRLRIYEVIKSSPGSEGGIEKDDLIVAIDGREIEEFDDGQVSELFLEEGTRVTLTVERDGQRFDCTLVLRRLI